MKTFCTRCWKITVSTHLCTATKTLIKSDTEVWLSDLDHKHHSNSFQRNWMELYPSREVSLLHTQCWVVGGASRVSYSLGQPFLWRLYKHLMHLKEDVQCVLYLSIGTGRVKPLISNKKEREKAALPFNVRPFILDYFCLFIQHGILEQCKEHLVFTKEEQRKKQRKNEKSQKTSDICIFWQSLKDVALIYAYTVSIVFTGEPRILVWERSKQSLGSHQTNPRSHSPTQE